MKCLLLPDQYLITAIDPAEQACFTATGVPLRGVLGNALGQRVQPSVAAAHDAFCACAYIRTARRRKTAIILNT
ncbi:hypothetical protein F7725_010483 [Dissostichus mawsoni]|uniref:Uncharacterized protein n=1 Tax=Dissostichus mawsoni TaxID=36200 RepID=A0A7J5XNK2_DISMA|nr:hypothetical protein F7725_010483 [Dissostichus mawsoni]